MFTHTGNQKPTFLTPTTVVKVVGEDLVMSIMAEDPEGRPVSYNLDFTTDPEITVNASGLLRWPSHRKGTKMIEVGSFPSSFLASSSLFLVPCG